MNDIESRLRDALRARAGEVEPGDDHAALDHITSRLAARRRRGLMVLGVAAALAVLVGAVALLRRDDGNNAVNVTTKPSTTTESSTTTTTSPEGSQPTIVPMVEPQLWPFTGTSPSAQTAAGTFAVDYLGMTLARVGKTIGDDVEIFPSANATARTLVRVARRGDGWVVVGAEADQLKINRPAPGSPLTSPLDVAGDGTAFEAQIALELRPIGSTAAVAKTSAMAGANGEVGPYATTITPPSTDAPLVLLAYEPDASDRGQMIQASVVLLAAAGDPEPARLVAWDNQAQLKLVDLLTGDQAVIGGTASGVAPTLAWEPTKDLVAYGDRGRSCRSISFVAIRQKDSAPATIEDGDNPVFSPDGLELGYVACDGTPHVRNLVTGEDSRFLPSYLPPTAIAGKTATLRGRFGTFAFFDGTSISSYNPSTGETVKLVTPAAEPRSLDADDSGRHLLWVDTNHDLWKWSGGDPVKIGSGFNSAAW